MFALACVAVLVCAPAQASDVGGELQHFAAALAALRAGDDGRGAELRASAERLCAEHERCDARDVAAYYLALTPEQRARGLAVEARWNELRERVRSAGAEGIGDAWLALRERVEGELQALIDGAARDADYVPAERARALIARLDVERVENGHGLTASERDELLRRAADAAARADAEFERAGHLVPRLEPQWLLARIARAHGDFAAARAGLQRTWQLAARVSNDDFREYALRGLAELARAEGDVRGEARALESIASFRDPRQSWPLARDWAARLVHDDHAQQALEFLDAHAPGDDAHVLDRVEWNLLRGGALMRLDDLDGAREHFERVASGPAPELAVLALASLALRERRTFEVLDLLHDEGDFAGFSPLGRQQAHALRGEALLADHDAERAVAELSRAVELADAWDRERGGASERDTAAGAAGSVIGERLGLHTVALLASAYAELGRGADALRAIEQTQARSLRADATVTRDDLAAWARQCELGLASWVVGADFAVAAHAFVDDAGELDVACVRIERGRAELRDAARRLREAVLAGERERAQLLGDEIRGVLWPPPLAAHLHRAAERAGELPRLLWLAHGPLEELPIEMLDLDALCGRKVCSLALPGLPQARPGSMRPLAELGPWTLFGAPLDAAGHEQLPGARDELAALAAIWPDATLALGGGATRERLLADLGAPRPLHVATHLIAECAGEDGAFPPASLLASRGERVCVHEIARLQGAAPWVVLAACASGGGERVDAEGLQGIARALLGGGTRNLVVTLWPVEDGAAAEFARALHAAFAAGATPSRAARAARDELRASGFGPADWAAFRALGRD